MENVREFYLKNGLKVLIKDVPSSTVSSVFVWIKTGSAYESDSERGLAHVHEHMIFKGTTNLGVGEISKKIEFYGGDVNAFTSFDETAYYATVSNKFVPEILDIFSQCMYDATFDSNELSKELEVILEEIKRGNDSPSNRLWDMVFESVFKGNDYSLPIIGTPGSVSSFKQENVKDFYNKWYVAKNMSLIVVGSISDIDIDRNIEKYFSKLKEGNTPKLNKNFEINEDINPSINFAEMDVNETYFNISFKSPDASDINYASYDLFSGILGSGESSILHRNIKEDLGLVTSISAGNYTLRHGGLFYIQGTSTHFDIYEVIYKIIDLLVDSLNGNFDNNQLQRIKTDILVNDIYSQETVQSQARTLGSLYSNNQNIDFLEKYKEQIKILSKTQILSKIRENLKARNIKINILSPVSTDLKKKNDFESILNDKINFAALKDSPQEKFKTVNYAINKIDNHQIQEINLGQNLRLLAMQNNKTPLISLRSLSLGGSSFENIETNGAFGLLSEMLLRGSNKFSKDEISMKTEILGAELSGFSGRNSFGLKMICPSDHLDSLIPIFSDVLLNPSYINDEFKIARLDTISYLNKLSKNSASVASDKFHELLFKNHPYALNQFGNLESINSINIDHLKDIHKRFITKNNLILCAVGNFSMSKLIDNIDKSFYIQNEDFVVDPLKSLDKIGSDISENIKLGDKEQTHIMVGTYAPDLKSVDRFAFNIINSVLSGMGGRLFVDLRDKKSLAYTVTSFFTPAVHYGYFGVYIGCSPSKKNESLEAINDQISSLIKYGVTDEELERAKNSLIGKNDISLQRNASINSRISLPYLYGLDPHEPFSFANNIMNIKKDDVHSVIDKYLKDANFVSVSVDPN